MEKPEQVDNSLWIIYQSVRDESISAQQTMQQVINWSIASGSAIIALLAFLVKETNYIYIALIGGWLVIGLFGLLGISQYAGEVGRMLRAGYYARLLEAFYWNTNNQSIPLSLMWETFLSIDTPPRRRLNKSYRLSGASAMLGLILFQFAPFVLVYDKLKGSLCLTWLFLPLIGSGLSVLFAFWQRKDYITRFSPTLNGAHLLKAHNIPILKDTRNDAKRFSNGF
jgi:hypothetical protein